VEVAVAGVEVEFSEGFPESGTGAEKVVLLQGKLGVVMHELLGNAGKVIVATGAFE